MSTESKPRLTLSEKAAALLGHLLALADSKGEVAVTRNELAKTLGASVPTVSRALRELKEAGSLAVVAEGGGRGQPTRYRIMALARNAVPGEQGAGGSYPPSTGTSTRGSSGKPYHGEPVHEPDHDLEAVRSAGAELGQAMLMMTFGLLEGIGQTWKRIPLWGRTALAGGGLSTVGALVGRFHGGRIGAVIGGAAGALAGALLATWIPGGPEPLPQQHAGSCPPPPQNPIPYNRSFPGYSLQGYCRLPTRRSQRTG